MLELWNLLLFHPLINSLIALFRLTGSLGWAIILLTVILRLVMTPLVLPSLRLGKKMQELAPDLSKLKQEFGNDKQKLVAAQAELYKKHGANPAAGCLPQVIQLLVLIALFNAFNSVLKPNGADLVSHLNPILYSFNRLSSDFRLSTRFLYLDLAKPDTFRLPNLSFPLPGLFLLLSAAIQLISSKMMAPVVSAEQKLAKKTPSSSDDAMVEVQQQMLYLFPLMTIFIGFQFPSGLVLYWLVFSVASVFQQYYAAGWGGLAPVIQKLKKS
ncbi:hypothetical protein A3H89_03895 [Candidatus Amesbacteria bacterium RIFCSPLOWO2_02_FULL_48_11]|uniref:Membrane insertase YidC/Oxa/ALB C-terminal domain-containing protein n=4 Tax=Candidatus Amesiibacteriota TaxID=1752730 RepID=A0A1F4Z4B1_9BACT|nr:MAG: Membrane protein insertase, YidC/Oxa1 family [Candidatus Amesbacteria bacterium GW2011_GWA2_47_11]KKU94639.1 MAG: Membrane protein insertase, YidC/Oxa1 family [Candidatus Amesbacteria bacterium GW2011_GWC1_48_10]OGD01115.1 MAG: hypothetical protein A3E17_03885 [Candidatus Amesbacteria bacterium RIFCSPHIGHO2_12_FULL_48_14]OGD08643.1 MAG: hypothetical protein A3H89_03895 [Candidatus Amesbacteria bacterium RIFCSPLOWO2_02_FULL_48_11]OGD11971.1 MAG: hypothetical protein A2576_04130 [Candidat